MPVSAPEVKKPTAPITGQTASLKRRTRIRALALVVACQLLAILFVEAVLYCAGLGEEEIFKFEPQIGFVHMKNKRITWRTEGFATSYLNDDGMREPQLTVAKPANTYRVAVLGDSMVEGFQVPIEQTFGEIIRERLGDVNGKKIQWLNFGTSGYSTVQEFLQLKTKVMKYKPDLVLACYDSRDIFENWSPPDQVVTNVRPSALHLPGGKLIIDSSQVTRWMGSPRGKFMLATTWLRQHSRIAGLLSALDLEWSQHNPWYRAMIDAFAHPVKARNEFKQAIAGLWSSGPSFQIKFFEQATPQQPRAEQAHVFNSASGNETLGKNALLAGQLYAGKANSPDKKPAQVVLAVNSTGAGSMTAGTQKAVATPSSGVNTYKALVTRTLKSLYAEMKSECQRGGAAFAVVALPVRSQLCPLIGTETEFAGIDYAEELQIVEAVCREEHIPMANVEKDAESLSYPQREKLFYTVHLTPQGQRFIADAIQPFVRDQLSRLP